MDKKLLDALNNLSIALESIGQALASKKDATSPTAQAMKGGNFIEEIKKISQGVKDIKKDTKRILSNQQTILGMSKKGSGANPKEDAAEKIGGDKKRQGMIKDGLGVIMLMAVAVLALGVAFKIVGDVNFFSVIAISTAIVLLSIGFAEVHKVMKKVGFQPKDALNFIIITVSIATAISISSWILSTVKPIGMAQFFTSLFIAGAFAVIALGMSGLLRAFKGKSPKEIGLAAISLPIILPAIALGIAAASWALQLVKPIGLAQFFTTLFIAGAFAVVAYGMNKMLDAFKGKSPKEIALAAISLPLILPAIALGIAAASWALQLVKPIGLAQFFTTLFIAAAFAVIAYGLNNMLVAFKGMSTKEIAMAALMLPVILVGISLAISLSSHILAASAPIPVTQILKMALLGISLAATALIMAPAIKMLSRVKVSDILTGGLAIVMIATAITVSSHILALGNYDKFPPISWIINSSIIMTVFGAGMFALGLAGPAGLISMAIGGVAALMVAGTIVGASHILALGNYGNGPKFEWATSVSLVMGVFGMGMMVLGSFILGSFGLGLVALGAGSAAVLLISETIVKSADILNKGKFTGGPKKDWAEGISLALGAFSPIYGMMMNNGIMKIFGGGGVGPDEFANAIKIISQGIVDAATFFSGNKVAFSGGPSKEWSEGVGLAIAAFSPVYKVLSESSGMFSSGPSVEQMSESIYAISGSIIGVAELFAESSGSFDISKAPSKEWGEGVGAAIGAFSPIYKMISEESGIFTSGDKVIDKMNKSIMNTARMIRQISMIFKGGDFSKNIPVAWVKSATGTLLYFGTVAKMLMSDTSGLSILGKSMDPIANAADSITKLAVAYSKLSGSLGKFNGVISGIDNEKLVGFKSLTGNLALLSLMDSEMFSAMLDTLEERAGVFTDIAKQFEKQQSESSPVVGKRPGGSPVVSSTSGQKSESAMLGEKLDRIAASLSDIQTVVGSQGTLSSYMNSLGKEANIGGGNNNFQNR